jgi:uncharacterized SAM-binding protein YcdF (DUF218 family)
MRRVQSAPHIRRFTVKGVRPLLVVGIVLLAMMYEFWLSLIGGFLIVADTPQTADAIIPLAGDRERMDAAAAMFKEGAGQRIVLTDMYVADPNPYISYIQSVTQQTIDQGVPPKAIIVASGTATSTYSEVQNIRRFVLEQGWSSITVVTSPYHTRRTRMMLREAFGDTAVTLCVLPVPDHWYSAETWWRSERGRELTATEYVKIAFYLVGYHRWWHS